MTIETKYDCDEIVFIIHEDQIRRGKIISIRYESSQIASSKGKISYLITPYVDTNTSRSVTRLEKHVFADKNELMEYISNKF